MAGAVAVLVGATLTVAVAARSSSGSASATPARRERAARPAAVDAGTVESSPRPVPVGSVAPLDTASPPRTIDIPAIGVHSDLELLHLDAAGVLQAPRSSGRAGWYAEGPQPGRPGPAVIAGHVDSTSGPAVFFGLERLRPGDGISVHRQDGTAAEFVVTASQRYPKARFPGTLVYAPTPDPELRLITCSGAFDRTTGHYLDNTVVSARMRPADGHAPPGPVDTDH